MTNYIYCTVHIQSPDSQLEKGSQVAHLHITFGHDSDGCALDTKPVLEIGVVAKSDHNMHILDPTDWAKEMF